MHTHITYERQVLTLDNLSADEAAFYQRALRAYRAGMPWTEFSDLIYHGENPLVSASGGLVTGRALRHPLFLAVIDLEGRLGIVQGRLAPEPGDPTATDPTADEWLPVSEAARRKGVSVQGIHQAITRGDLIARPHRPGGTKLVVSAASLDRWTPNPVRKAAGIARAAAGAASRGSHSRDFRAHHVRHPCR
ncbi:MAG: hypothetical protein HYX51_03550 [Chloroflexi bacterium]|nr:hypothetical protein [Chloroflexota bacterium]